MRKIMRPILLIVLLLSLILINYIRDYKYTLEDDTDKDTEKQQLKIQEAMDAIKKAADRVSDFTNMVGPKVNSTLNNITQVISEVSNVVTKDVMLQVNTTMANINEKLDNLNQKVEEASKAVTDDIRPHMKETMTNFSKNVDKVSNVLTHRVGFTLNETMGVILRYLNVDTTSSSTLPDIRLVTQFLVLCLALLVTLYAAYQTKKLLGLQNNEKQTQKRLPNFVESIIIHVIYWACLVLGLMLAITVFTYFFTLVVDQSQLTWIRLAFKYIEDIPNLTHLDPMLLTIVLLCSVTLAFVFIQHRRVIFEYITDLTWFTLYILFRLPIRLLLDPPHRAYGHLTSSCCKASCSLLVYTALCTILPSVYYYLISKYTDSESMTLWNVLIFVYIPFYVMALVVYLLATTFSWTLENIVGFLFTEKPYTNDEKNLHVKYGHRRRINYRVQYYT